MTKTRALTGTAVAAVVLAIGATAALASNVVKGATYRGHISRMYHGRVLYTAPITFKVTRDGTARTAFTSVNACNGTSPFRATANGH